VSEDPIGLAGGANLMAYVGGDPIAYVDPSGQFPWVVAVGIGVVVGGITVYQSIQNVIAAQNALAQQYSNAANNPSSFDPTAAQNAYNQQISSSFGVGAGLAELCYSTIWKTLTGVGRGMGNPSVPPASKPGAPNGNPPRYPNMNNGTQNGTPYDPGYGRR